MLADTYLSIQPPALRPFGSPGRVEWLELYRDSLYRDPIAQIERERDAMRREVVRQSKALAILSQGTHLKLGQALLSDLADCVGMGSRESQQVLDLGKAIANYPGFESRIANGEVTLEKALIGARGIVGSDRGYDAWLFDMRHRTARELARQVEAWTLSREVEGGRIVQTRKILLSPQGRAMLADLEVRMAQLTESAREKERLRMPLDSGERWAEVLMPPAKFEKWRKERVARELRKAGRTIIPLGKALARAVHEAIESVKSGGDSFEAGARKYRLIEHTEKTLSVVAGRVGGEEILLRLENPMFELRQTEPESGDLEEIVRRIRARHGLGESVDALEVVSKALERGVAESEERSLALVALAELRKAVRAQGDSWYRIAKALACLEELGFRGWGVLAKEVLEASASTTSEILSCGRACQKFPELDRLAREGKIEWTKIRTLGPYLTNANLAKYLPLLEGCTVRELEAIRGQLAARRRGGGRPGRPGSWRTYRIEAEQEVWKALDALRLLLEERTGRRWSEREALEETLWLALRAWGAPRPLWHGYRILIHHDPKGDVYWMRARGELFALSKREVASIMERGRVKTFDLGEAIEKAEEEWKRTDFHGKLRPEDLFGGRLSPTYPIWIPEAPPADEGLRRLIYLRDSGVCSIPGCRASRYLEIHHWRPRGRGGQTIPSNLGTTCTACHGTCHSNYGSVVPRHGPVGFYFEI